MQLVANMDPALPLSQVANHARRVEAIGYDALHVAETIHDPFSVSTLALEHTERLVVRTAVALAFVRSPMAVAYSAWELASFSRGRFELGLGTQIRANIVGRYSVDWHDPVGRMRDYIGALRAIFHAFQTGDELSYESEHYRFSRLQPYFDPRPIDSDVPSIWLGAVGARMCRLAGECSDGLITHPTSSSRRYLEEVCLPNLLGSDVRMIAGAPVVTGATTASLDAERERQRRSLAFLYSTPAYRRSLELFGWTDLGERLQILTRQARWDDLPALITDDVLDALLLQATHDELGVAVADRYGDLVDGVLIPVPVDPAEDASLAATLDAVRASCMVRRT